MDEFSITEDKKSILRAIQKDFLGKRLIIIEAPPGAGKTFLSVISAQLIIKSKKIEAGQKVLILTFSRNARAQLEKEALNVLDAKGEISKSIEITNFHAFFQKYVWAYRTFLKLPLDLILVWPVKRLTQIRAFSNAFSAMNDKIANILSSCLDFYCNNFIPARCPKKYEKYMQELKKYILKLNERGYMAYEDLAYQFLLLLKKSPFLIEILRAKYPILILDEYQDSSDLQNLIVQELLGDKNKAIIFADDMQMIHRWRGASATRINDLKKGFTNYSENLFSLPRYKDCEDLKTIFETLRIVFKNEKFDTKIKCNKEFFDIRKSKIPDKFYKSLSKNKNIFSKERAFNSYIAKSEIIKIILEKRKIFSSIAILLPYNSDVTNYKGIFREKNINVGEISSGNKQHDFVGLILENIKVSTSAEKKIFLLSIMNYIDFNKIWEKRTKEIMRKTSLPISGVKNDIRKILGLDEIVEKSSNFKDLLIRLYDTIEKNKSVLTLDFDTFRILKKFTSKLKRSKKQDFGDYLLNILLQEQYLLVHRKLKGVYVLNIHQAKGKEFDMVILPDVTETAFPIENEDKRKLFYVGVTRARKKVILFKRSNHSKIIDLFLPYVNHS